MQPVGRHVGRSAALGAALTREGSQAKPDRASGHTNIHNFLVLHCLDHSGVSQGSGHRSHRAHEVVPVEADSDCQGLRGLTHTDRASWTALDQQLQHALANAFGEGVFGEGLAYQIEKPRAATKDTSIGINSQNFPDCAG
jgi:hypothetical protein